MQKALLALALLLQDMTNALLVRKFTVSLGVLKDKGPAVILGRRTLTRKVQLLMDVSSFLELAKDVGEATPKTLEGKGYVISKKGQMDNDFTIPSWAFPRAQLEILLCAQEIVGLMKKAEESLDMLAKVMKSAGVSDEEIEKLKKSVTHPEGRTLH